MYQRKTPKTQEAYKSVYVGHNPHTIPLTERKWPDRIRVISIDPGVTHYAIRVEERNMKTVGPITTIHFDKIGLAKDKQELSEDLVCAMYSYVSNYLDQYLELFKTCHMVIIEKQLPINYRAVRMSQHTLTYFMTHLKNIKPNLAMFFEVNPQLKGRQLGAPASLNEKGIKTWSVEKAFELLNDRNDQKGLEVMMRKDPRNKRKEKKDDLADVINQAEALFSYFGWPVTQKVVKINPKPVPVPVPTPITPILNIQSPIPVNNNNNTNNNNTVKLNIMRKN